MSGGGGGEEGFAGVPLEVNEVEDEGGSEQEDMERRRLDVVEGREVMEGTAQA